MKRATITLPDDVAKGLEAYRVNQDPPPTLTAVVQAALHQYLAARGYLTSYRSFRITPADPGSGTQDISIEHDRYFTEASRPH